jgi:small subunit ribosomal protein S9
MMTDEEKPDTPETSEETPEATAEPSAEQQAEPAAEEQSGPTGEEQTEPTGEEQPEPTGEEQPEPTEEVVEIVAEAEAEAGPTEAAQEPAAVEETPTGASGEEGEEEPAPRGKPSVPGAHLEVDIVPEGVDPLGRSEAYEDPYAIEDDAAEQVERSDDDDEEEEALVEPISTAAIDLASGARYRATGKRKTAIARVTLRPGTGTYLVNGRVLEQHFPRVTLQRNIRQPLEAVGYQERMDVVARLHGGGISAQAGALRHGVSRALLEADPNLRGELKRRGFLTRDSRAKERKKAGLKKARKRPQFSKR